MDSYRRLCQTLALRVALRFQSSGKTSRLDWIMQKISFTPSRFLSLLTPKELFSWSPANFQSANHSIPDGFVERAIVQFENSLTLASGDSEFRFPLVQCCCLCLWYAHSFHWNPVQGIIYNSDHQFQSKMTAIYYSQICFHVVVPSFVTKRSPPASGTRRARTWASAESRTSTAGQL